MRKKNKMFSILLAACLIAGLFPISSDAAEVDTGKSIQLGTSGIEGYSNAEGYNYIYFGNWKETNSKTPIGPIKWRVLDTNGNAVGSDDSLSDGQKSIKNEDALYLLSDAILGTGITEYDHGGLIFQNGYHDDGDAYYQGSTHTDGITEAIASTWQGSDAQKWCMDFAGEDDSKNNVPDAFTDNENNAILETKKSDAAVGSFSKDAPNILNGDKVFFMSAEEAWNTAYGFTEVDSNDQTSRIAKYGETNGLWWLRSPFSMFTNAVYAVNIMGVVYEDIVTADFPGPRPAFNLNSNEVLFTSAAVGGKLPGSSNTESKIFEIPTSDTSEWKLTLLDNTRQFDVVESVAEGSIGDTITFNYSGATIYDSVSSPNEYISVIIADDNGAQYYGRLLQPNASSGQISLSIPKNLSAGEYDLHIFSEQYNGGVNDDTKLTDYASAFNTVKLNVKPLQDNDESDSDDENNQNASNNNAEQTAPKTGDNSNLILWFTIALIASYRVFVTFNGRRKSYTNF